MNILPGMALTPIENNSIMLEKISRVISVDSHANKITVIEAEPTSKQLRKYFKCPRHFLLSSIIKEINCKAINLQPNGVRSRPDVLASDEALNAKYGKTPCSAVRTRQQRFEVINSLINNPINYSQFCDDQVRNELIEKYCKENSLAEKAKRKIQQIVFQFLAEGSTRNALTPYSALKGGRGKERQQKNKLGRPNAPSNAGIENREGFKMSDRDKELCGFAFRNYLLRGVSLDTAYRKMCRNFYAERITHEDGRIIPELYTSNNLPSCTQFRRWGPKYSGEKYWEKQLNKQQLSRINRAIIGNANDEIYAVGQLGAIDSTTTDTELVSVTNRLLRVGTANRVLLVDTRHGYIPGFDMGIEAVSNKTVKLAILHAASDKTEWLASLGLDKEVNSKDWIPILFSNLIADNTDLRNTINIDELTQIGIGIKFIPTHRSDMNSVVESAHHTLHRLVDHKLPGTTRGRRLERGDEKPVLLARMTIIEAIRETARAIHLHNTIPLDIPITLEIRREIIDRGLDVNRLNLTRMDIENGRVHSAYSGVDELICKFGQTINGTFTPKGVKLHRTNTDRKFVKSIRYVSNHTTILSKLREAKTDRNASPLRFDSEFICNPMDMNKIYYRDIYTGELIPLKLESPDIQFYEYALPDYLSAMDEDATYKHYSDEKRRQQLAQFEEGLDHTIKVANYEYNIEKQSSPPIAKTRISRDKKKNRQLEKQILKQGLLNVNNATSPINHESAIPQTQDIFTNHDEKNLLDDLILGALR